MNNDLTRQFLDACHEARRICEILPNLPDRVKPRHIRIIRCIHIIYSNFAGKNPLHPLKVQAL